MRIQIDCRNFSSRISGIGKTLIETINRLNDLDVELVLNVPKRIHNDYLEYYNFKNVSLKTISGKSPFIIYQNFSEDIFWGPAHRLPIGMPPNLPAFLTVHDVVWLNYRKTMSLKSYFAEKIFFERSIKRADKILCVSKSTQKDLINYFPEVNYKSIVVLNGANKVIQCKVKSNNFFLFIGTFEPRKNIEGIIKAFSKLPVAIKSEFKLIISGSYGWKRICPYDLANKYNVEKHVIVITNPTQQQIEDLYSKCWALLFPSFYEGFGLPIVEAMSYGKPVITSNISSMPEVLGKGGLLVDPNSTEDIANSMIKIATDIKLYKTLSKLALKQSHNFSWNSTALNLYKQFSKIAQK